MDLFESDDPEEDVSLKRFWGCAWRLLLISPIVFLVLLVVLITDKMNPSDWVEVNVRSLPSDADYWFVVAEDSRGISVLPLYYSKVFSFTHYPDLSRLTTSSDRDKSWWKETQSLQWKSAERYGVLIRRRDEQWRFWWLKPEEIRHPSLWRFIISGQSAGIWVPGEDQAVIPSQEFLGQLNYSER